MSLENIETPNLADLDAEEIQFESVGKQYMTPGKTILPGDSVIGEFVGTEDGRFGKNFVIRTKVGVKVFNGSGSLKSQMEMAAPKAGDLLKITYEGSKRLDNGPYKGKDCHMYNVKISRR
jgi:hypothetical protein